MHVAAHALPCLQVTSHDLAGEQARASRDQLAFCGAHVEEQPDDGASEQPDDGALEVSDQDCPAPVPSAFFVSRGQDDPPAENVRRGKAWQILCSSRARVWSESNTHLPVQAKPNRKRAQDPLWLPACTSDIGWQDWSNHCDDRSRKSARRAARSGLELHVFCSCWGHGNSMPGHVPLTLFRIRQFMC